MKSHVQSMFPGWSGDDPTRWDARATNPSGVCDRPGWLADFSSGKVRPAVLLWALGVPIPIVLLTLLIRSWVA